jgi:hypothetical protein
MAVYNHPIDSYKVLENKVDVSPVFGRLLLPETPLLNRIGIGRAIASTRHEWWDDVLTPLSVTLNANYDPGLDAVNMTLVSTKGLLVNTILKHNDVIYKVTEVSSDTAIKVAVVSGSNVAISSGEDLEILSNAGLEGDEYVDSAYTQKVKRFNIMQIFRDYIKITGTQLNLEQYVNEDIFVDEVNRKLENLRRMLEKTLIKGVRVEATDNTTIRLMGGLDYFISQEGIVSSATFTEANFKAFLKLIWDKRGFIGEAWMHPTALENFLALNASSVRIDQTEDKVGRTVRTFVSPYGETVLRIHNEIPTNKIYVFDPAKVSVLPLQNRQFTYEQLAKTGDYIKGQIVGEYTVEFRNPDVAGVFVIQ